MFCYQCEQTSLGTGCDTIGICGKTPEVAILQDLMLHLVKGISMFTHRSRQVGFSNPVINDKINQALFMTLTNVNFDKDEHLRYIGELVAIRDQARQEYTEACKKSGQESEALWGPALWEYKNDEAYLLAEGKRVSIPERQKDMNPDMGSLEELLTYGVKGLAAYAYHAKILDYRDESIYAFVQEAMDYLTRPDQTADELVTYSLRAGETNLKTMELLDRAHTETLGHPVPTTVRTTHVAGKAILVSGHDMKVLLELLKQTEGKGINVYTHGEMLPGHGYPELHKFKHLVGNYGGAWQNQQREFSEFPGAILMTTNCIKKPLEEYNNRIFTMDVVGWENTAHLEEEFDYSDVIEKALALPGFASDASQEKTITVGFGHHTVLGLAEQVVGAVKSGAIKHFYVVGGCDGAESYRDYFTEFATSVPNDCVVMTMGCGKYRFNKLEFGEIEGTGIPRLLDLGQCNDSYSAVVIASALAEVFETDVNGLPLSLVVSWFEQKAVAVLLTLLHLGIKNIRLGPALPAFISPNILNVLVEKFNIMPTGNPQEDIKRTLGQPVSTS